jgi:hypothetical protein
MRKLILTSVGFASIVGGAFLYTNETQTTADANGLNEHAQIDRERDMEEKKMKEAIENGDVQPIEHDVEIVDANGTVVWTGKASYYKEHADEIMAELKSKHDMIPTKEQFEGR